ncbi:MAG: biotin transporter BioY [Actinobacteria bacterium]|nr:biotin transporter BioY [Actinomycetota bacterium]
MAAVLSLLSLVAIPLPISPVPFTLQTLGVYVAAGLLGPRWGTAAVAVYLLVGVAGLPVFAGGEAGVGVLLGPKGGYLMAFLPAASLVGLASRQLRDSRGSPKSVGLLVAGLMGAAVVIYALGAGWLAMVTGLGATQVIVVGVVPFVPGDAVKLVAAAILIPAVARARRAARS